MNTITFMILLPILMGLNSPLIGLGWFDGTSGIVLNVTWCLLCAKMKAVADDA